MWDVQSEDASVPYHRRFDEFPAGTVQATDELFLARPSRLSLEQAHPVFVEWMRLTSTEYGVSVPTLEWDPSVLSAGGGAYAAQDKSIRMSHISITTLLHEYRHHLQSEGAPMCSSDVEIDARAWSLSLYFKVRPRLFADMVRQGRIQHISPEDLD